LLAAAKHLSGTIDQRLVLGVAETDNSDDLGHDVPLINVHPRLVSAVERRTFQQRAHAGAAPKQEKLSAAWPVCGSVWFGNPGKEPNNTSLLPHRFTATQGDNCLAIPAGLLLKAMRLHELLQPPQVALESYLEVPAELSQTRWAQVERLPI
jgi:hypothetical protein